MAFGPSTITDFGGAANDIMSGYAEAAGDRLKAAGYRLKAEGDRVEGINYGLASDLAGQNEQFTAQSTAIKQAMAERQIYQAQGSTEAAVGGSGLSASGSALDILRSNASQGAIQKAMGQEQGLITEAGYTEQQTAYKNLAAYSKVAEASDTSAAAAMDSMADDASTKGYITGGFKAAAGLATLF